MADGQTTNFHWSLPENHVNTNLWGGQNNANWQDADTKVYANQTAVAAINARLTPGTLTITKTSPSTIASVIFANSSNNLPRWQLFEDAATEGAGNTNSNLYLNAYSNTGTVLSTPMTFTRATGAVTFAGAATFGAQLTVTGVTTLNSTLSVATGDNSIVCSSGGGYVSLNGSPAFGTNASFIVSGGGRSFAHEFYWSGTRIASFDGGGNFVINGTATKPGGGSWTATSDARIKNVVGDYELGLDEVLQLRPIVYSYKGNDAPPGESSPHVPGKEFVGFIAQEVEPVFPDMVSKRAGYIDGQAVSDLRDVDTSELLYALVNSVRQLKAEIEALKAVR